MSGALVERRLQSLRDALNFLRSAVDLLDSAEAPAHIAAHVDLAMCQLEDAIDNPATQPCKTVSGRSSAH